MIFVGDDWAKYHHDVYVMVVQLGDDAHGCAGGAANAAAIAARAASCLDRSAAWIVARRPRHRRSS
jgi:hypothetical protein